MRQKGCEREDADGLRVKEPEHENWTSCRRSDELSEHAVMLVGMLSVF